MVSIGNNIKKLILIVLSVSAIFLLSDITYAADLIINGQNGATIENTAYDRLSITNSSNITIRNCSFSVATGYVGDIRNSSNITIENSDFNGQSAACVGLHIGGGSYIYLTNNEFHDIADDGIEVHGGDHLYFTGNTIRRLLAIGTDGNGGAGPCYNGHSDGMELSDINVGVFDGNLIYDVRSTSAIFMGNWGGLKCRDLVFKNNIFYTPEAGFVAYVHHVDGIELYNNIYWQGMYGGVCVNAGNTTGMVARNNITHSWNFSHHGIPPNSGQDIDYSVVGIAGQGYSLSSNDVLAPNPGFGRIPAINSGTTYREVSVSDFYLLENSPPINNGVSGQGIPVVDYLGNQRDSNPDMGAIEYGGTIGSDVTPPVLSSIATNNITSERATITWVSNEPANSQVEYGSNQSYGLQSPVNSNIVTLHSITLVGLSPETQYHYRVNSADSSGNNTISGDYVFTTLPSGQVETVPEIPVSRISASADDGNAPQNTVDNNVSTRWSAEGDGQWIQFDFGDRVTMTHFLMAFYNGDQRTTSFDIEISSDGNNWSQALSATSSGTTLQLERFDFANKVTARYVRIIGHGNSTNDWNSITEIDFFGVMVPKNLRVVVP